MQVVIHGKNIEVIDKIKNAVKKTLNRLQKKYARYLHDDVTANVGIEHNNYNYKVAIHIQLLNKNYLQCSVANNDLYVAIKQVLIPLEQQLCHLKTLTVHDNESVKDFFTKEKNNETEFIVDVTTPDN